MLGLGGVREISFLTGSQEILRGCLSVAHSSGFISTGPECYIVGSDNFQLRESAALSTWNGRVHRSGKQCQAGTGEGIQCLP